MTPIKRYYGLRGQLQGFNLIGKFHYQYDLDLKEISNDIIAAAKEWGYDDASMKPICKFTKDWSSISIELLQIYTDDGMIDVVLEINDDISRGETAYIKVIRTTVNDEEESKDDDWL